MRNFIDLQLYLPRWNSFLLISVSYYFILVPLCFVIPDGHLLSQLIGKSIVIVLPQILFVLIYVGFLRKSRPAKYLLVAFLIFFLGGAVFALRSSGVLPTNFFTWHGVQIGSSIEIVLLSLGLADRINMMKNELVILNQNIEKKIIDRTAELAVEKEISDELLLNILPSQIAKELKDYGRAKPVLIDSVTVMFTDFVGFTQISEKLSPEEIISELDMCFSYFDQVTEKYNLEKLKTIGDSFMCAGGIPLPNRTHAIDCCLAALEIQAFMNQMKDIKIQQGYDYWELRLGMNSGPVVAGVVGQKKFAYDVWGDTVNMASRLETGGVPGRINLSESTYLLVEELFECEHRGLISAKHKGLINMYFLNGIRRELSVDQLGKVPNQTFLDRYRKLA